MTDGASAPTQRTRRSRQDDCPGSHRRLVNESLRSDLPSLQSTGLGTYDEGYFPELGLGLKMMSLGGDVYLEVESIVDHQMILDGAPTAKLLQRQAGNGTCFAAWCLRSDDYAEMEAFAKHRGIAISKDIVGGLVGMGGPIPPVIHVPDFSNAWLFSKPNMYYEPDMTYHPSRLPMQPGTAKSAGTGVTSIEIGEDEEALKQWLGEVCDPRELPFEIVYNNQPAGLYRVRLGTTDGEKEIRLPAITL